jgi:1-acyl-sn-glycerol-3-phosphate acyltransferase
MKFFENIINGAFRFVFRLFFKIDTSELKKVPQNGPLLLIANHTSFLDGPLLYVFLQPRHTIAMAKKELWNHWFTKNVMNMWKCIPVDRENMNRESMQSCLKVLDEKNILAIAPEGTRNKEGNLQQGKSGVAFIAYKQQAPMIPVITLGFENFKKNFKRLRRTPILVKVGEPFTIVKKSGRLDSQGREDLMEEIMLRLAALLPAENRGFYTDKEREYTLTTTDENI